jgi:multicomponent Na+:H+ antiporter subunit C
MSGFGVGIYLLVVFVMMTGLYVAIARGHLVKKLIGLNLFQTSVFYLYISLGFVDAAAPPILDAAGPVVRYSNPLPSVLILTAIVVGVATTALGLALVVRIRQAYGTAEEDEIHGMDASL